MGGAHWLAPACLFGRIFETLYASDQAAFATIAEGIPPKLVCIFLCHSERSEESLISSMLTGMRRRAILRDPSHWDDKHGARLYQTALAKIAEITAGGTLHKVYGELEQANFPRVVYTLDDRAERFVFVFDLPPGAIDHRVD